MILNALDGEPILEDGLRRDILNGSGVEDLYLLNRDGKTDTIASFQDDLDKIDLTRFNVTWAEVEVKLRPDGQTVFTVRGERTLVQAAGAEPLELTEDDFIFNEGAADPVQNVVLDQAGATVLIGTDQPDVFVFAVDNTRDVIKRFDPNHDQIDLVGFGTNFADLEYTDRKPGKVVIKLGTEGLVVRDLSLEMTSADFTADMFVF